MRFHQVIFSFLSFLACLDPSYSEELPKDRASCIAQKGTWRRSGRLTQGCLINGKRWGLWIVEPNELHHALLTYADGQLQGPFQTFYDEKSIQLEGQFDQGELQGPVTRYDQSGFKIEEISYDHGKMHGPVTSWYSNCFRKQKGQYEQDLKTGHWTQWNFTGRLSSEGDYTKGLKTGIWSEYDREGHLQRRGPMVQDKEEGEWEFWDAQGQSWFKKSYKNGELQGEAPEACRQKQGEWIIDYVSREQGCMVDDSKEGLWQGDYPGGALYWTGTYKQNRRNGMFTYRHQNGQILVDGQWKDDIPAGAFVYRDAQSKLLASIEIIQGTGDWEEWNSQGKRVVAGRYENGKRKGEWHFAYDNGQPKEDLTYDGVREGPARGFFETGELKYKGAYHNDFRSGHWVAYYMNGRVAWEGDFKGGQRVGDWVMRSWTGERTAQGRFENDNRTGNWQEWYENGKPSGSGSYKDDEREGEWQLYWSSGEFWKKAEYISGIEQNSRYVECLERHGEWIEDPEERKVGCRVCRPLENGDIELLNDGEWRWWHPNGNLEKTGSYSLGEPSGHWNYYYDNGQIRLSGDYQNGIEEGRWEGHYKDGDKRFSGEYVKGRKQGQWNTWYDVLGELQTQGDYQNDQKLGPWRSFYPNGHLKEEGQYAYLSEPPERATPLGKIQAQFRNIVKKTMHTLTSAPDGLWKQYYESGHLKSEGSYRQGKRDGLWRFWHDDQTLWREIQYQDGQEQPHPTPTPPRNRP